MILLLCVKHWSVKMKILECFKVDLLKYGLTEDSNVFFLRIDPEDLSIALHDILSELANFSWLSNFDKEAVRKSMETNAKKTCDALREKFFDENQDPVIAQAGEYIVSVYSKRGVVEHLGHSDVPLAELLGRKKTGNPGFDFFTEESNIHLVTCGEAKYVHGKNAYTSSLAQINRFISDDKHVSDVAILNGLVSDDSLDKLVSGHFGVCAAFSSTKINTDDLIKHICTNTNFEQSLEYDYIILAAVDIS